MSLRIKQSVIEVITSLAQVKAEDMGFTEDLPDPVTRSLSQIGSIIGSPLGLLPALQSLFAAGRGKELEYMAADSYKPFRLQPQAYINLLRRGLLGELEGFDPSQDMRDQGINPERMAALLKATEYIPTPQDLIQFAVKEVYAPETAKKFGQYEDFPTDALPDAEALGLSREVLEKYWAAHWNLPSPSMGYELLHRGIIDEDTLKMLLKALDIMPYWRDKLVELSYNIPTRVDVRRFYDLGVIDEDYLRKIYRGMGYHGDDLEAYILWTKIYTVFPDILARYKNGWITEEQAKLEIVGLGMSGDKAEKLWQSKVKSVAAERTVKERDLTKSELYKAVKTGRLDRESGVSFIAKMGYDASEAQLLMDMNVPPDEEVAAEKARLLTKSEIKQGLKIGSMNETEALKRLLDWNYTPPDAAFLIQLYTYVAEKPTDETKKQVTKADIVKGVKDGLITAEEGFAMLLEINYDEEAANFILYINPVKESHSITRAAQFVALVNSYRSKSGQSTLAVSPSLASAENDLRLEQAKLNLLTNRHAPVSEVLVARERVKVFKAALDRLLV